MEEDEDEQSEESKIENKDEDYWKMLRYISHNKKQ